MKILIIGGGGREHALAWKIAQSPLVEKLYCAPGNPGIARYAECVPLDGENNQAVCEFVRQTGVELVVIGPEAPLMNGLADDLVLAGVKVFGPKRAAARIEGSKSFAKDLMKKYRIPTGAYRTFDDVRAAKAYIERTGAPVVVKADGLAAGKGVIVALTLDEALAAVDDIMVQHHFGAAGSQVVIEEYLEGEEASLLAFTDGRTIVPMVAAQDHKRIFDGDQGPNTGGMGAYAPAPVITSELREEILQTVLIPAVEGLRQEGCSYQGCLYAGLMITAQGPKVIEFNARFGDPETQAVLPLLNGDLVEIMLACAEGGLDKVKVDWHPGAAVCVVMAAAGYPGSYESGNEISGIEAAEKTGALVFQAGTSAPEGKLLSKGGRVLGISAVGKNIAEAVAKTYAGVENIQFQGCQYRRDIAHRALARN